MRLLSPLRVAFALLLLSAATVARAQIQAFGEYQGKRLPVIRFRQVDNCVDVIDGSMERRIYNLDLQLRTAPQFIEGFVTIADVSSELDILRHAPEHERSDPNAVRARYRATITAQRDLSDCYGLLTFVTQGSIGMRPVEIGNLSAGQAKKIEVNMTGDVDVMGSLHVFSKSEEVRTNQHPDAYDFVKYCAELTKNVKGVPAAALLKVQERYPHELSRDGRMLATVRKHGANKVIIIYNLDSMEQVSETPVAPVDDYVHGLKWVTDHQLVYIAPNHDQGYVPELHLLEASKGTTRLLLTHVSEVIRALPNQPEVLELHSIKNGSVFMKYNVLTEHAYDLDEPTGDAQYYFDAQGTARIELRYREAKRLYSFRPTRDSRWRDIDELVKEPGLFFNGTSGDMLERVADIHSVSPDGDTLYISTRLHSDKFQLAAFSMSQGVIKKVIGQHPLFDLTTEEGSVAQLLYAKESSQLLGMTFLTTRLHVVWLHPQYAAAQKAIDATFPDHINLPIDWSKDGKTMVYFSYSDRDPGTYYVFRPDKPELIPLLPVGQYLEGKALGQTTPIEVPARDGAKVPAYVTMPPDGREQLPPLLVYVHGGPMARDAWGYDPLVQFFATRGFVVLQVNYRGSSGYGAAFQAAGLKARLDTVIIDDIADSARLLIKSHKVDPNRVVVMGASFGGWATYLCLAKYPDLFRVGVAISAPTSWKQIVRDDRWLTGNEYGAAFWRSLLTRQNYEANAQYIDPLLRVAEIKQPVFIVHGEQDNVVDATQAKHMLEALKKQGTVVEAKSFLSEGHVFWRFNDKIELLNEAAAFIDRNLPPAKEAAEVTGEAKQAASAH